MENKSPHLSLTGKLFLLLVPVIFAGLVFWVYKTSIKPIFEPIADNPSVKPTGLADLQVVQMNYNSLIQFIDPTKEQQLRGCKGLSDSIDCNNTLEEVIIKANSQTFKTYFDIPEGVIKEYADSYPQYCKWSDDGQNAQLSFKREHRLIDGGTVWVPVWFLVRMTELKDKNGNPLIPINTK